MPFGCKLFPEQRQRGNEQRVVGECGQELRAQYQEKSTVHAVIVPVRRRPVYNTFALPGALFRSVPAGGGCPETMAGWLYSRAKMGTVSAPAPARR
ncbi:hypothetical protein GCM10007350_02550 [Jeongeupia chitinilytica]|uniref:Uncharacterized protein n=1 Tax=Jeongeupia chitinilytica TaxID=1041641 RepID=A0ABQ3GUW5_9NEIS|nr:hypothetical protein GCM10007350_02550 [Jeongeupia chitinilytica]